MEIIEKWIGEEEERMIINEYLLLVNIFLC